MVTYFKYLQRKVGRTLQPWAETMASNCRCHTSYCSSVYHPISGDMSSISMLGTRYVVLNSFRAISAILEKQSSKCSNRPHPTMASELVGMDKAMLFMECDDRFRQYRKIFSRLFGSRNSTVAFNLVGEEQTRRFLCDVLRMPANLAGLLRW